MPPNEEMRKAGSHAGAGPAELPNHRITESAAGPSDLPSREAHSTAGRRSTASSGAFIVEAEYLPPAGRRRLPALLVRRCPRCGLAHLHRGKPGIREGSCGVSYAIVLVEVADR